MFLILDSDKGVVYSDNEYQSGCNVFKYDPDKLEFNQSDYKIEVIERQFVHTYQGYEFHGKLTPDGWRNDNYACLSVWASHDAAARIEITNLPLVRSLVMGEATYVDEEVWCEKGIFCCDSYKALFQVFTRVDIRFQNPKFLALVIEQVSKR